MCCSVFTGWIRGGTIVRKHNNTTALTINSVNLQLLKGAQKGS